MSISQPEPSQTIYIAGQPITVPAAIANQMLVGGQAVTVPSAVDNAMAEAKPKKKAAKPKSVEQQAADLEKMLADLDKQAKAAEKKIAPKVEEVAATTAVTQNVAQGIQKTIDQINEKIRNIDEQTVVNAKVTAEQAAAAEAEAIRLANQRAQAAQTAAIDRLAAAQEAANAAGNAPVPAGTKTVRKVGGVVQTVQLMYDPVTKTTTEGNVLDEYKDTSAREDVLQQFKNVGLDKAFTDSLIGIIDTIYDKNVAPTSSQIENEIFNSEPFKKRFAANETIRKRIAEGKARPGDRLLSPAEYIEVEKGYTEVLRAAGLPSGFYDSSEDFSKFIENGISNAELTARVNVAQDAVNKADQNIVKALQTYYNLTPADLRAYMLDPQKAFDLIDSRFKYSTEEAKKMYGAAEIGGAALRAGVDSTKATAEEIYAAGKGTEAEIAFQRAAADKSAYERLIELSGGTAGTEDLVRKELALTGGAEVAQKIKSLASEERARFQKRSAIEKSSLGRALPTSNL
jgi:hypothetical protein